MILPPAWIENSIETYIYQHTTKSQVIYWVVLATIVLAFVLLPFVYVDISIQSNGVIRQMYLLDFMDVKMIIDLT